MSSMQASPSSSSTSADPDTSTKATGARPDPESAFGILEKWIREHPSRSLAIKHPSRLSRSVSPVNLTTPVVADSAMNEDATPPAPTTPPRPVGSAEMPPSPVPPSPYTVTSAVASLTPSHSVPIVHWDAPISLQEAIRSTPSRPRRMLEEYAALGAYIATATARRRYWDALSTLCTGVLSMFGQEGQSSPPTVSPGDAAVHGLVKRVFRDDLCDRGMYFDRLTCDRRPFLEQLRTSVRTLRREGWMGYAVEQLVALRDR